MSEYNLIKNKGFSLAFPGNISDFKNLIINHLFWAFVVFLLLTTIIVVVATFLSYYTILFINDSNQNCTNVNMTYFVNQNSPNFVNTFANTLLTLGIIIFSALSLSSAQEALKQSHEQQEQFQNEQRIRDIEKRLELFYIPAQNALKISAGFLINPKDSAKSVEIFKYKRPNTSSSQTHEEAADVYAVEKLKEIEQYRFLAKYDTCRSFKKYVYEEESSNNRLVLSGCIQNDVEDYLDELYKLKSKNECCS